MAGDVDPRRWPAALAARRSECTDERQRAVLDALIAHVEAEIDGNVGRALASFVAEPVFRGWCGHLDAKRPFRIERAAIEASYEALMKDGFPPIEVRPERVAISSDGIAMDGEQWSIVSGDVLARGGHAVDPARRYLTVSRFALVVSFDDGAMCGEDQYWTPPIRIEALS